jgi:uncharacterized membrane protein YhdT
MSKLQKSAWVNLGLVTALTLINMLMLVFMAKNNAKGVDFIIVGFVPACIATPIIYIVLKKKSIERNFDEREKMVSKRAFMIAALGLFIFLLIVCFVPFFVVGGGNVIKVIYLPIIFNSTLLVTQFIYSMVVIIQCTMEEEDG